MKAPKEISLSLSPMGGVNRNSAALFTGVARVVYSDRDASGPWGIMLLVRPINEAYFSFQVRGWPPAGLYFVKMTGEGKDGTEECFVERIYIGNMDSHSFQADFEIYAVAMSELKILRYMSQLRRETTGLAYVVGTREVELYDSEAVISPPALVHIDWADLESKPRID